VGRVVQGQGGAARGVGEVDVAEDVLHGAGRADGDVVQAVLAVDVEVAGGGLDEDRVGAGAAGEVGEDQGVGGDDGEAVAAAAAADGQPAQVHPDEVDVGRREVAGAVQCHANAQAGVGVGGVIDGQVGEPAGVGDGDLPEDVLHVGHGGADDHRIGPGLPLDIEGAGGGLNEDEVVAGAGIEVG